MTCHLPMISPKSHCLPRPSIADVPAAQARRSLQKARCLDLPELN